MIVRNSRGYLIQRPDPCEHFWAVGSGPAYLAHRAVARWPGNNAVETACGNSICLHGEGEEAEAWGERGGRSYADVSLIPSRYRICLKCVIADEALEEDEVIEI